MENKLYGEISNFVESFEHKKYLVFQHLGQFFLTGDLFIPPGIDSNDPVVQNLVDSLDSAMNEVLNPCIDPTLRAQYKLETQVGGAELLKFIRADCENVTNREIAQLIQNLCCWTSVGCDTSDPKVTACLRKLVLLSNRDPFVNRLAGVMHTLMMKNKQAEFRVVDVNIDLTLSSAMREVRDLKSSVRTVPSSEYQQTLLVDKSSKTRLGTAKKAMEDKPDLDVFNLTQKYHHLSELYDSNSEDRSMKKLEQCENKLSFDLKTTASEKSVMPPLQEFSKCRSMVGKILCAANTMRISDTACAV
ncbi:hypothetical protein CANINC_001333 [Pichia inconspicua]|uniref:Uncharacterized protein n=1 Tax=Pichia inconspicua TaxID=52247 RepID=A0A4T0X3X6_9ASCO|nr:hypothetical protein CANINC_001333 [[Candida] inconspicua]